MEKYPKMDKEQINTWLKENIVHKVIENLQKPYDNVTWEVSLPENSFFLSSVMFVDLHFGPSQNSNKSECIPLVIKTPGVLILNELMNGIALFHNEILFYKRVSRASEDFPRCLYFLEDQDHLENAVIVTENIGPKGFNICPESYDIPFEYVISGMQAIGRFHAMGYVMKTRDPQEFFQIVEDIQETRYIPGGSFGKFINLIALRPVEWLRKQNYDPDFVNQMEKHLSDAFNNVMIDAVQPVEPLAVLCHGDFTRNNVFFRRTDTGLDSMLIDFAMMAYSSPSTDLSTFLYICCSSKDRKERFSEIFKAYHDALIKHLREGGINDLDKYSYDKMMADYKRRAMFGYMTAIFFMPVVRGLSTFDAQDIIDFDPEKSGQLSKEVGGDKLSEEFADILLELREGGCLDHIICVKK